MIQQDEFTSTGTVATRDVTATCVPNKGRVAATQSDEHFAGLDPAAAAGGCQA